MLFNPSFIDLPQQSQKALDRFCVVFRISGVSHHVRNTTVLETCAMCPVELDQIQSLRAVRTKSRVLDEQSRHDVGL